MLVASVEGKNIPMGFLMLFRYCQRRVEARRQNSASHEELILEYIVAVRVSVLHSAGSAKKYVTGKNGSRLHNAATDTMLEGRRGVDVDFMYLVVVLIAACRQRRDEARPRRSANQRVNKKCFQIPPEPRPSVRVRRASC